MRLKSGLIVFAGLLIVFSVGAAQDYSKESFKKQYDAAEEDAELSRLYRDFVTNAEDIDIVRDAQSKWERHDSEAARAHAKQMLDVNPNSARYTYLYGRVQESPVEQIRLGRRTVELDPEWSYGYRLILATYVYNLFDSDSEHKNELAAMVHDDKQHFAKLIEIDPEEIYPYQFLFDYQVYANRFTDALNTLQKAKQLEASWPSQFEFATVYAGMGRFDDALEMVEKGVSEMIENGSLEEQDLTHYTQHRYTAILSGLEEYDAAITYVKSTPGFEADHENQYNVACAYSLSGNKDSALAYLAKSAENGWYKVEHTKQDPDLESLHDAPGWDAVISRIQTNWDEGRNERKKEALADKVDEVAPKWTLEDSEGQFVSLADLRGNVVVLDFWATWCGPCRMAMPGISEFTRRHAKGSVRVFSVNIWEKGKKGPESFMEEHDYAMTLLYGNNELAEEYGVQGIPFLCVIDPEGKIRYKQTGYDEGLDEKLVFWTEDLVQ